MKKLDKKEMKKIIAGGEICLECAYGYYQVIIQGRCYCVPWE
ncbi:MULTISPECIES: GNAT family acetyltransferase [Chryseobacterium]|nr:MULTISPECIES: GNAT family acetyltransferase [Chryseobacterium]MBT2621644.1 GNAT family acetyltransferase [Chryseobacterium sp. ISL-6]